MGKKINLAEFDEIEADIGELEAHFGDLGFDDDEQDAESGEMSELETALAGTEFDSDVAKSSGQMTFMEAADGVGGPPSGEDAEFSFLNPAKLLAKFLAKKAIRFALKYVRRSKFAPCARLVAQALRAFKAKRYGTALKYAYRAGKCIKARL